jgi:tRNA (uracil-5-)-methyltransferase TRM9
MPQEHDRKIIRKVRDDYDLIAPEWDRSRSRPSGVKLKLIAGVGAGMKVLDVGCGNGLMLPSLLEKGAHYFGLDISARLIAIARQRYAREIEAGRADFAVGSALELPFGEGEFDFVLSFAVLHHIPSAPLREKFLSEIRRVLRPGGKGKIIVWNLLNGWTAERFGIGAQLQGRESGDLSVPWKGTSGAEVDRYLYQFSPAELAELAAAAGFSRLCLGYFNRAGEEIENGEELVLEVEKT